MGAWRAAALASQFGVAVVGSLVGGVLIGQFLDRRLGTAPACFLAGLLLGLVASIYLIYTIYRVQVQPGRATLRSTDRAAGGVRRPAGLREGEPPPAGLAAGAGDAARADAERADQDRADRSGRTRDDVGGAGETRDIG